MNLGRKLGYDLKEDTAVVIINENAIVETVDVSISVIINQARRHGLHGKLVNVYCGSQKLGMVIA